MRATVAVEHEHLQALAEPLLIDELVNLLVICEKVLGQEKTLPENEGKGPKAPRSQSSRASGTQSLRSFCDILPIKPTAYEATAQSRRRKSCTTHDSCHHTKTTVVESRGFKNTAHVHAWLPRTTERESVEHRSLVGRADFGWPRSFATSRYPDREAIISGTLQIRCRPMQAQAAQAAFCPTASLQLR